MIHRRIFIGSLILLILATSAFLITQYSLRIPPKIISLSKLQCLPGEKILIEGEGFGHRQGNSRLYFGNREMKVSHIDLWDDQTIRFRVPSFEHSAKISIKTSAGESDGGLVYNRDQFPQLLSGSFLPGLPYIEYVDPSEGSVGKQVELKGYDFGNNRGVSRILVNRKENNSLSYFEDPDPSDYTEPSLQDYILWENDLIRFYLPEQAVSGFIYIETPKGYSNPVYFDVERSAGKWEIEGQTRFMLSQQVLFDRIGAYPDNIIYLWLPRPDNSGNQHNVAVLNQEYTPFLHSNGVDLIRIQQLETGDRFDVTRSLLVDVVDRRVSLEPSKIPLGYNQQRSIYLDNTKKEPPFPLSDSLIRSIAVSVCRGENHPYNRSLKIYNYVIAKLHPGNQSLSGVSESLNKGEGDSENYADTMITLCRIMGIPARKVAGIRLTDQGSIRHFWVEIYFEEFDWFTADPYLADLLSDQDKVQSYWGAEGFSRIAFSRGSNHLYSVDDNALPSIPQGYYALQNLYQEKSGNLSSFRSQWIIPEEITRF